MGRFQRRVLIVAQQIELRARIARVLHSAGYAVELAGSQKRAVELAAGGQIGAAIVVHGTELNGLEQELRDQVSRTIVLDHRTDEILRPGHSLGGADAFPVQELDEQKLLDWLNRPAASPGDETAQASASLRIGDCQFDLAGHTCIDGNGREVQLTRCETALLAAFVASPCRVLSRDQLRRAVVGRGSEPNDRSVDMLIARLRRKIEPNPKAPRFILSAPGVGYKLAVKPQAVKPQTAENGNARPAIDEEKARPLSTEITSRHSEPERRQLTALSCMLADFPAMTVRLDPEEVFSIVQRFQQLCSTVVTQWGGIVVTSLSGSGNILALFGYPKGHEHDTERAVYAGLDLLEKVGDLPSAFGEPLKMRAAIATGLVLIGGDQAAVGDAVVIAGQLRNLTPPNSVNVTASTLKLLGNVFLCDDPKLYKLDGVSEPVTAYRVTGKQAIGSRFVASRTGKKLTQFVGRQHELQQLSTRWERAKAGKGQVVLICGEAGIGKSRLCEAWLDRIADEPHIIIRNQCSPHHTNTPFYPMIQQLEHAARLTREDTRDVKLGKLETVLSQAGAATLADTPIFAALLSIPIDGFDPSPTVPPQRQRELTIAALLRQVLGLALTRPVVIKIADVDWSDSSTLELLGRCIESIKTARVFVLCSFRREFFTHWLDELRVTMLRLDRLSREQTGQIISEIAGGKELPCGMQEQILSKADGVPLFAEELTNAVLESGLLRDAGDQYVTTGSLPSVVIPRTLLGSLTARLDRLRSLSKEVAQIASAIGREFSYRLLAAVAPASGPSLESAIQELASCGLAFVSGEPPDATYIFKHALVQDAAYATMPRSKRQQLHSRIADALIAVFPETIETQPELVAYHLAQAGLSEKAIEYLRKAGQRAIERSANAEAIGHLTHALQLLEILPQSPERKHAVLGLEVMLSQATIASAGYTAPETREILLRARASISDSTDPAQKFAILYGIWACDHVGGDVAKQEDAAAEFLAEAEQHNDTGALCIAHRILGTTYVRRGKFDDALGHLEQARALYDLEHHGCYRFRYGQDIGVTALCYLSLALWHLGYVNRASQAAAEAMKRAEELSHPHTLVFAICLNGFLDIFRRRPEDAQVYADRVVSLCTENGFSHWVNCGRIFEGWAKIHQGEVDQGLEALRAGVLGWQNGGARLFVPLFLTLEAKACFEAGRTEAALQAIEKAFAVSTDTGECCALAEMLRVKARLLQAAGWAEAEEIETILVNSLDVARHQQARCCELRASCDLARLWQEQGLEAKAIKLLQSIYEQFTEGFDTADLRDAKALMRSLRRKVKQNTNTTVSTAADVKDVFLGALESHQAICFSILDETDHLGASASAMS